MAIIKSAKKRIEVGKRNRKNNLNYLNNIHDARNEVESAKTKPTRKKALSKYYKAVDKAAKTRVIHPNKASRLKSQLA